MKTSAGLLLFRAASATGPEVLLGHMGGPFWARKDAGAWSIPKGEYEADEEPLAAALREFAEEMGSPPPPSAGTDITLGSVRQSAVKTVTVFARRANFDADHISSNTFELEWPPRSGRVQRFPEIDRAQWFSLEQARDKLVKGQLVFLDRLAELLQEPGEVS